MADVSVQSVTVFRLRCRACGFNEQFNTESEATERSREHQGRHDASRGLGPTIAGQVFDSTRGWHGTIWKAAEVALAEGYPFMEWNGMVYTTSQTNLSKPLAWAKDVPGLVAS